MYLSGAECWWGLLELLLIGAFCVHVLSIDLSFLEIFCLKPEQTHPIFRDHSSCTPVHGFRFIVCLCSGWLMFRCISSSTWVPKIIWNVGTRNQSFNPGKRLLVWGSCLIFLIYWGNQKALFPSGSSLASVSKPTTTTNPISKEKYGQVIPFKKYFGIFRKDLWETGTFLPFSKSLYPFDRKLQNKYKFLKFSDENIGLLMWIFWSLKYTFPSTSFMWPWNTVASWWCRKSCYKEGNLEEEGGHSPHNQNNP